MILLDNGHGQNTPGKRSPIWPDGKQLFEWQFTREIVRRIQIGLNRLQIESVVLVPETNDVPLRIRVERANTQFLLHKNSFLISVHGNASPKPNTGSGWEIWTSPGETESDRIADRLFFAARANLPGFRMRVDYSDGDPDKESQFYILRNTLCPSVLTENLFYDNYSDCHFMMSEEGKLCISQLHIEGILQYLHR